MKIDSNLITLKEIEEKQFFFNIPIYQRLFVWEEEQIKILLEDIETAFSDGKELFYLGGVLVVENEAIENGKIYDLIDGQQRFTTLWMISIVFGGALKPFVERFEKEKNRHRVTFAIRDDIYLFFKEYINGNKLQGATSHIVDALSLIHKYKEQYDRECKDKSIEIANFINEKVKLIFTEVPKQTDLNKLFEIINNRGVQLQHHEILKSHLLNKINSADRLKYSYIWDACSYMESYVEKNIRDIAKIRIQDLFDNESAKSGDEKLASPLTLMNTITEILDDDFKPLSLNQVLTNSYKKTISKAKIFPVYEKYRTHLKNIFIELESETLVFKSMNIIELVDKVMPKETPKELLLLLKGKSETDEYEADEIRSIITFPMLLQHTLRIFLAKRKENDIPKILDKELLNIFTYNFFNLNLKPDDIKEFIELLWRVRYYFDKHVIKWVRQEDSETHLICKLEKYESRNNFYLRRRQPASNEGEALLQSMLYHSQQITTHYWLTPYLNYLLNHNGQYSYEYLKRIDNYLLCSTEQDSLIVRSRKFLEDENYYSNIDTSILSEPLGTAFPHYWFYKLEYILWEKYSLLKDERWKAYKMSAKNSVEHISPQTQKDTDTNTVSKQMLNNFGNLSLVSRSINSEYSNLPYNEKRVRFNNKNKIKLDSLKMDLIYNNEIWNDNKAREHQQKMINLINEYLGI